MVSSIVAGILIAYVVIKFPLLLFKVAVWGAVLVAGVAAFTFL